MSSMAYACGAMCAAAHLATRRADLGVVPGRGGHELLQLLVVHTQALGHRLHRLALAVQHQPAHVQLALGPLVPALQRAEHLRSERLKPRTDLIHLLRCHT